MLQMQLARATRGCGMPSMLCGQSRSARMPSRSVLHVPEAETCLSSPPAVEVFPDISHCIVH